MKIRHEINILNTTMGVGNLGGGSQAAIYVDPAKYNGNLTFYFEVIATSTSSVTTNIQLERSGSVVASLVVPSGANNSLIRLSISPLSLGQYNVYYAADVSGSVQIKAARVIIIQDTGVNPLTATETQIEVGAYQSAVTVTTTNTLQPLAQPKYWKFDSSKWDGTLTCFAEVTYLVSSTMGNKTIVLQQSDGTGDGFVGWTTVATMLSAASGATTATRLRSTAFTPINGRNYRIAWTSSSSTATVSIYNAKVIVQQPNTLKNNQSNVSYTDLGITKVAGYQTIQAFYNITINNISLTLSKIGSPAGTVTVSITNDLKSVLGSLTFNASTLTTTATQYTYSFSTGITLTAGVNYYIKVAYTGDASNYIRTHVSFNNNSFRFDWETTDAAETGTTIWSNRALLFLFNGVTADDIKTKLEIQYLLANATLAAGTGLQNFLTKFDPAEWDEVNNTYVHQVDASNDNTSVVELATAAGTQLEGSVVSSPDNSKQSTTFAQVAASSGGNNYVASYNGVAKQSFSQSFSPLSTGVLKTATVDLWASGLPTGNIYAKIYAHSGTMGSSSVPTGPALAVSYPIDAATLPVTIATATFSFGESLVLTAGQNYVLVISLIGITSPGGTNDIAIGYHTNNTSSAIGNGARSTSETSWTVQPTWDLNFTINLSFSVSVPSTATNLDVRATTNSGSIFASRLLAQVFRTNLQAILTCTSTQTGNLSSNLVLLSETTLSNTFNGFSSQRTQVAQSVYLSSNYRITSVRFKTNNGTGLPGNAYAKIYAASSYSSAVGSLLFTSNAIAASTMSNDVVFTFDNAELQAGYYYIAFVYEEGSVGLNMYFDSNGTTLPGIAQQLFDGSWSNLGLDLNHSLYGVLSSTPAGSISANNTSTATQSGALTGVISAAATNTSTATQTGILQGVAPITATNTSTATQTGAIIGISAITASLTNTATQTGTLTGKGAAAATNLSAATQVGALTGLGVLAATNSSTATQTGNLRGIAPISATLTNTATQSGNLNAIAAASASSTSIGATTGTLQAGGALAATNTSTATQTANISRRVNISATNTSAATQTGVLTATGSMVGTASGVNTATATVFSYIYGTASSTATGTGTGTLAGAGSIAASSLSVTNSTAQLSGAGVLQATSSSSATSSANLAAYGPLAASNTSTATASGQLTGKAGATSNLTNLATSSANLTASGALGATNTSTAGNSATIQGRVNIAATGTASATSTASLAASASLNAVLTNTSTGAATLTGQTAAAATGVGNSTAAANLSGKGALGATNTSAATQSGAIAATGALAGSVTGVNTATATVFSYIFGTAASNATATGTGTIGGAGTIAGSGLSAATQSGALTATGTMQATSAGASSSSATLGAAGVNTGNTTGQATTSAQLIATGGLAAVATSSASSTATARASGVLSASVSCGTTQSGVISAKGVLIATSTSSATSTAVISSNSSTTGQTSGVSTSAAVLKGLASMAGATTGQASAVAIVYSYISGSGSSFATGVGTATAQGVGSIAASSLSVASSGALIIGKGTLAGASVVSASVLGELVGKGLLSGESGGVAFGFGDLAGDAGGYISGAAFGSCLAILSRFPKRKIKFFSTITKRINAAGQVDRTGTKTATITKSVRK